MGHCHLVSGRLKSARPPSARPAAPRLKEKTEVLAEEEMQARLVHSSPLILEQFQSFVIIDPTSRKLLCGRRIVWFPQTATLLLGSDVERTTGPYFHRLTVPHKTELF